MRFGNGIFRFRQFPQVVSPEKQKAVEVIAMLPQRALDGVDRVVKYMLETRIDRIGDGRDQAIDSRVRAATEVF